jgi:3-oxoacyl-[acyl-carrier protein] reductase
MPDLSGKVALVTGASRGIGRAVAMELADRGATVVANYAGSQQAAEQLVAAIEAGGGAAFACKADVSDAGECSGLVDRVVERYGRIDVLVNNAGITRDGLLVRMSDDDWDAVIATNLTGVFSVTRAAAKHMMKARTGSIVNVTSVVGLVGNAGQANYAAAKAGVIGLTKSVARELAGRGVRCNAVAPGFIETDMTAALSDSVREQILGGIAMKRFGEPGDVAKAVAFLASADAAYITGQVIAIDGGMTF